MNVGDAVKWLGDDGCNGCVGIVTHVDGEYVIVLWGDGLVVDYDADDIHTRLEVI